jgi:hypothetical protein
MSLATVADNPVWMNWMLASVQFDVESEVARNFANRSGNHHAWALLG